MNKKILAVIGLVIVSIMISWNLFKPGFFSIHDDLHVMRLYEMKRCLNDGQIPCRWSPDMGAGYGQPMFSYYSATPYYLGAVFKNIGFSFLDSIKIIMFISISLAGISMFLFLSEFLAFLPSFIGGAAYMIVPFRALEIFVRGALAENFALALLPLVLFGIFRLIKKQDRGSFVLLSLFSGFFLASHNITSLISSLVILPFTIIAVLMSKNKQKSFFLVLGSAILGVGLASFFLLPVIFENNLINTSLLTSGYFDFRAHFATLNQLFINQNWGYGASEFGPNDKLSFAVGIIQTLTLIAAPIIFFIKRKSLESTQKTILITFWVLGIIGIYFTTIRSINIWEKLSFMSYIQFPWRFLGVVAVCSSAILAIIINTFREKTQKLSSIFVLFLLLVLNSRYFRFEKYFNAYTDNTYLTGSGFIAQEKSAISDYRPISTANIPENIAPANPVVLSGLAEVKDFQKRTGYFSADVIVYNGKATVAFPVSYFPNWTVYLNSSIYKTPFEVGKDFGEITLTFEKGTTLVQGYLENTPIRAISDFITFISLLLVLVIVLYPYDRKNNQ